MKTITLFRITALAVLAFLVLSGNSAIAQDGCQSVSLASANSPITGDAILCVNTIGAKGQLVAHNLIPKAAYTIWFVYFDNPALCAVPDSCSGGDLINPADDPVGVFGRFSNAVADTDGTALFKGEVPGFTPGSGSQVWLTMFVHGPASDSPKARARQLLTPETPALGAPGEGVGTRKGFMAANAAFQF
ncbi:MAG: hypothetical protein ACM3PW_08465 [Chlamydiota bacterium]